MQLNWVSQNCEHWLDQGRFRIRERFEEAGDFARDQRSGIAASGLRFGLAIEPGNFHTFPSRQKGNHSPLPREKLTPIAINSPYADDTGKVGRPFANPRINIAARGYDLHAGQVGLIDPFFVVHDIAGQPSTSETAIDDLIAP